MAIERIFTSSPLAVHNFFMRERNQWSDFKQFNYPSPCYTNNNNFRQESWYSLPEIKVWNTSREFALAERVLPGPGGSLLNLLLYCTEINRLCVTMYVWTDLDGNNLDRWYEIFMEEYEEDTNK